MSIAKRVQHAEELANYIRENLLTDENLFDGGEINWNFVEADIVMVAENSEVRDKLPPLPVKVTNFEQIDAAFDLISESHVEAAH